MAKLIAWEEIQPGMTVYVDTKPRDGEYPPYETIATDLEPHYIDERLPNGQIAFHLDFFTEVIHGRLLKQGSGVRYWTDGHPYLDVRKAAPWTEEVSEID